jgi:hypothetical protein
MLKSFPVVLALLLLTAVSAYVDVTLDITTSSSDIAFNLPLTVAGAKCPVAVSLSNKDEFVSPAKGKGKAGKGKGL